MKKETIQIDMTSDYVDCELCGGDDAEGCLITFGEWSLGGEAYAHCYNGFSNDAMECFIALYKHLNLDIIVDENKCFDLPHAITLLKAEGYEVKLIESYFDYNDYHEQYGDDYGDDYNEEEED